MYTDGCCLDRLLVQWNIYHIIEKLLLNIVITTEFITMERFELDRALMRGWISYSRFENP